MLSKLLRGSEASDVRPYSWRPVEGSPVNEGPPPRDNKGTVTFSEAQSQLLTTRMGELETKTERRVKEVRATAYGEGEAAARSQNSAEVRVVLERLSRSIQELAELRPKLREQAEADVVRLAMAVARRVVHRELNTDPDSIVGLLKVALGKLRLQETVRVRVHPDHVTIIRGFLSGSSTSAHIEVVGDAAVGLGGCVFETTRGEFDVSTDVQLDEIEKGLTDRLAK